MRVLAVALIIGCLSSHTICADDKDPKESLIREIIVPNMVEGRPQGSAEKPTIVKSADDLAKAVKNQEAREKVAKEVDFAKEQLVLFAWAGSGQDKVTGSIEKGDKGPVAMFHYERGLTRDLRGHVRLFAVPKEAMVQVKGK